MGSPVEGLFSQVHRVHFKRAGWTKVRHVFTRVHDTYTERVQFQGSAWNGATHAAWRFYVNFGVAFHGLPPRLPDRDLPGTHCWARLESIVDSVPGQHDLPTGPDDDAARTELAARIVGYVEQASQRVSSQLAGLRARFEQTRQPRLICS